jgi:hypothetical protein
VALVAIGYFISHARPHDFAQSYYEKALASVDSDETVFVGGDEYRIRNGVITSAPSGHTSFDAAEAYRIAYAAGLARRSPILGIVGTDPEKLRNAATDLQKAALQLAYLQNNAQDARAISESLYPFRFLYALADAEDARRTFLGAPSAASGMLYTMSVDAAIKASIHDIEAFRRAFNTETANSSQAALQSFGGIIRVSAMSAAIDVMRIRFNETMNISKARSACLRGNIGSCDDTALSLDIPTALRLADTTRAASKRVRALADFSSIDDSASPRIDVRLSSSVCLADFSGPYHFRIADPMLADLYAPAAFANDIFFNPVTARSGPVPKYLQEHYEISLIRVNPMNFYICPEVQSDLGSMYSVLAITRFAMEHSGIATERRQQLLSLDEDPNDAEAFAYLAKALEETHDQRVRNELLELAAMARERSGNFDSLVGQIAAINALDKQMIDNGVPFDVSAATLFLAHSAFPSLYLSHNSDAGITSIALRDQSAIEDTMPMSHLMRYSELPPSVSQNTVVRDMRSMRQFERDAR